VYMVRCTAKEIPPVTATRALGPITWGPVYQRLLEITRDNWRLLEITGDYWRLLELTRGPRHEITRD